MNISIPDEILSAGHVSEEEIRLELAIVLYQTLRVTLGQASQVAGLPQAVFLQALGRRNVPVNHGVADLEADLKTLEELRRK